MFGFLNSDWFNISLEIVFLLFAFYDIKQYMLTKKKEYITNVVLTLVFFIWTAIPYYNSYVTWNQESKDEQQHLCLQEDNATVCECVNDALFKEFTYETYQTMAENEKEKFFKESKEECLDDSWF